MINRNFLFTVVIMLQVPFGNLFSQNVYSGTHYHNPEQIQQALQNIYREHRKNTRLINIATSPGGQPISVFEIGSELQDVPAVFVGANFEGNLPVATEGALRLIEMLLDSAQYTSALKWYILPQPNPDAAGNFFSEVKYGRTLNDFEINNDADEAENEDGYEDLNGDGFITQMRVKSLNGTHILSKEDSRILVKADASKGERGNFKIYQEGIDNDNDGEYNEDGEGGINVGISFPHLFPEKKKEAGLWPGQTPEVYSILQFIYEHPEIAMVYTLGNSDFCLSPPKGDRKGDPDLNRIKLPGRYARMLNADENQSYTLEQVTEMVKATVPGQEEVTPQRVAGMLNLGEAVNPLEEDLKFYSQFSEEYRQYLKARNANINILPTEPAKDGSFELWAYYHLGVPSFSMNLFSVPLPGNEKANKQKLPSADDLLKMSASEFSALGDEIINNLLKELNASESYSASSILEKMKEGNLTPGQLTEQLKKTPQPEHKTDSADRQKALLDWSDEKLNGNGFIDWQPYEHPQLGEVEIGGFIPYLESTPEGITIDSLLSIKLPWLLQLAKKMPEISIAAEELQEKGSGIYKLDLYVENRGQLPWPIAMGQRNDQPAPLVLVLEGDIQLLEGLSRTPVNYIGANQVKKLSYLIKINKGKVITAKLESAIFPDQVKQIKTGGRL